jgi:uncharacterized damage-inducible protein DinB
MNYLDNFKEIYNGDPWLGESFMGKLEDVTEKEAFTQPIHNVHSIAELVAHVIYWRSPIIKKLKGEKNYVGKMDSPENWLTLEELKAKGWTTLLEEFEQSQTELVALLRTAKPQFYLEDYKPGVSWFTMVEGVVQHDVYHLGQLALVKKMIRM